MKPKVSVVIPAYNAAQYICETIDSVLSQTYKDYEIIVVDDGSTDNTKEILQPHMGKIRYMYKENGGPASARNVGIKNAQGEYIAFLDSDDLWLPEKLEKQVRYFEEYPEVGLVFTDCIRFNEKGSEERHNLKKGLISDDMFVNIWWENLIPNLTVMVRKSCFEKVGVFDESKQIVSVEDREMWLRIAREYRVGYLEEALAKYRIRQNGLMRSNIDRSRTAGRIIIDKYWKYVERRGYSRKLLHRRLYEFYFDYGFCHFYVGNLQDARKPLLRALKYNPMSFETIVYYLATFLNHGQVELIRKIKDKMFS